MAQRMPTMEGGVATDLADAPTAQTWRDAIALDDRVARGMREWGLYCYLPVQYTAVCRSVEGLDVLAEIRTYQDRMAVWVLLVLQHLVDSGARGGNTVMVLSPSRELANNLKRVLLGVGTHTGVACFDCSWPDEEPHNVAARSRVVVGTPAQVLKSVRDGRWRPGQTSMLVVHQVDEHVERRLGPSLVELYRILPPNHQMLFTSTRSSPEMIDLLFQLRGSPFVITDDDFPSPVKTMTKQYYSSLEEVDLLGIYIVEDLFESLRPESVVIQCGSRSYAESLHRHLQSTGVLSSALVVDNDTTMVAPPGGAGGARPTYAGVQVLIVQSLTDENPFPVPKLLIVHDCSSILNYQYAVDMFGNVRPDGVCVALFNQAKGDGFVKQLKDVSRGHIKELMADGEGIMS